MAYGSLSGDYAYSSAAPRPGPAPHIEHYPVLIIAKASFLNPRAHSLAREAGIPGFGQGIRHEVYAEYSKRDREAGKDRHPPGLEDELLGIIEHRSPAHYIGVTQPEKAEPSLDQDRTANLKGCLGDDRRQCAWQDVA